MELSNHELLLAAARGLRSLGLSYRYISSVTGLAYNTVWANLSPKGRDFMDRSNNTRRERYAEDPAFRELKLAQAKARWRSNHVSL